VTTGEIGAVVSALAPFWIVAAAAVVVLISIAVKRSFAFVAAFAPAAVAAAFAAVLRGARLPPNASAPSLLAVDGFSLFAVGLVLAAGFLIMLLSAGYVRRRPEGREEFYLLILVALLGASVLAASRHVISLLLGLEVLSVPLFVLIAHDRDRKEPVEAGIKYLVLASASAAFLLFGAALVYGETGALGFDAWGGVLAPGGTGGPFLVMGFALMVAGIGFKLAIVPFHMWTPDIYQGAPAPVAAFVATVSKGAMFAFLLRFFLAAGVPGHRALTLVFSLAAAASMLAGNILALLQDRVKRLLAFSSIAHLGYLLVAFLAGGQAGAEAAGYYLVGYFVAMLCAFGAVIVLSRADRDADHLEDFRGLFWRRPWVASVLALALLSLAGIPLTVGFLAKFYVAAAGVDSGLWALVIILVATSVVGLYYYLRVVTALFTRAPAARAEGLGAPVPAGTPAAAGLALVLLAALLVLLGLFPQAAIDIVRTAAFGLGAY
jgi:NADH-quinone oxidoreductase subunit N